MLNNILKVYPILTSGKGVISKMASNTDVRILQQLGLYLNNHSI